MDVRSYTMLDPMQIFTDLFHIFSHNLIFVRILFNIHLFILNNCSIQQEICVVFYNHELNPLLAKRYI